MEVKVIDIEKKIVEVRIGQKRRGWIKVKFKELDLGLVNASGCQLCLFYLSCSRFHDPICARIISEITAQGFFVSTPPHFCLCRL